MASDDIAIVGLACVFPKASDAQRFWANNVNGVDAVGPLPPDRWTEATNFGLSQGHEAYLGCQRGGFIETPFHFDPLRFGIIPNAVLHGDPDQFFLLHVIAEALKDAGIGPDDPLRDRTDVIAGRGGYYTHKMAELCLRTEVFDMVLELIDRKDPGLLADGRREEIDAYLRSTLPPNEAETVSTAVSNITASRAANRLNLQGAAYVVDAACASSLAAVEDVVLRLRAGRCDVGVAAGLFLSQTPTLYHVFTRLGALSPTGVIRPFDRNADGLVVGEGGGAVILKRFDDAVAAGDRIYALIKGLGSSSDGAAMDVLAPNPSGQVRALERAYEDAGVSPDSISYLEAHGTGTAVGDLAELQTIKRFFGPSKNASAVRPMGSVKSMVGHTMPAAGMASLIRVAMALSNKVLPPSLHCEQPHPEFEGAPFYLNTDVRPWVRGTGAGPRRAGINAFGFGGINVHAVLEEVPTFPGEKAGAQVPVSRPILPGLRRSTELVALGGGSVEDIMIQLKSVSALLDDRPEDLSISNLAFSLTSDVDPLATCRLAMIVADLDDLRDRVRECSNKLANYGGGAGDNPFVDHDSIHFTADGREFTGKVACIMPGMGLQMTGDYPAKLMELAMHFPAIREEFDFFDNRDGRSSTSAMFAPPSHLPEQTHQELKQKLAPPNMSGEWVETAVEQHDLAMTVTLANWAAWELLSHFEVPVDMLAGQSQGEVSALCAAGVADFHEVMPKVWASLESPPDEPDLHDRIWEELRDSRLCFVWADEETVQPLLKDHPGIHLAISMTPESVIVGGAQERLAPLIEELRREEIFAQPLPFPPIHSPALAPLRERLRKDLEEDDSEKKPATITLYSSVTTMPYPEDPEEVLETLMLNLDHPLRLWQTVRQMHEDGARVFIQLGGGGLVGHIENWLEDPSGITAVSLDAEARDPITQINQICGTLWTVGVPVQFGALFANRDLKPVSLAPGEGVPADERPRISIPLRLDWTPLSHPAVPSKRVGKVDETPEEPSFEGLRGESEATLGTDGGPPDSSDPVASDFEVTMRGTGMPFVGRVDSYLPGRELVVTRTLDLDEDIFLIDHPFVYAEGVKPPEECLPILAMSFIMEFVAEIAAGLCPGQGLIGFEDIRAFRWIGLRDVRQTEVEVTARAGSLDPDTGVTRVSTSVHFEGKESFSATCLFGESYRCDLTWHVDDPTGDRPWPWTQQEVYGTRRMFHGPAFQCVTGLGRFGNPVSDAELVVLPKDGLFASIREPNLLMEPCLVDGLAQIIGLWAQAHGWFVLPTGVEKLEVYCPTPPVGTKVRVRLELREFDLDTKQLACRFEVEDGHGRIWMRAEGWRDWIFKWSERFVEFLRVPSQQILAEKVELPGLPAGSTCVWLDMSDVWYTDLDWASRVILNTREIPVFRAKEDANLQRQLLWSRAAIKDAARVWAGDRGDGILAHPATLVVDHDSLGRPELSSTAGLEVPPSVSLSHKDRVALAMASSLPAGIDFEPASKDLGPLLSRFAAQEERGLLEENGAGLNALETRLWCAKEAVAKRRGTGFQGRPKDLVLTRMGEDGVFEIIHEPTGEKYVARTIHFRDWIVAYSVGD